MPPSPISWRILYRPAMTLPTSEVVGCSWEVTLAVRSRGDLRRLEAGSGRAGSGGGRNGPRKRMLELAGRLVVGGQQFVESLAQLPVVVAFAVKVRGPIGRLRQAEGEVEQCFHATQIDGHGQDLRVVYL